LSAISEFNPRDDDCVPDIILITTPVESISVATTGHVWSDTMIMLDTQVCVYNSFRRFVNISGFPTVVWRFQLILLCLVIKTSCVRSY
jgi:hypothetical protein